MRKQFVNMEICSEEQCSFRDAINRRWKKTNCIFFCRLHHYFFLTLEGLAHQAEEQWNEDGYKKIDPQRNRQMRTASISFGKVKLQSIR